MPKSSRLRPRHSRDSAARSDDAIDLGGIDLKLLSVFDAVMSESSFSRAARRLGMTQSAVSQAMARLRPLFDDDLFERTGRGVRPTPRALELSGPIRQGLNLLRSSLDPKVGFDPEAVARTFFIAMQPHVAEAFAVQFYEALPQASKLRLYIVPADGRDLEADLRYGEPEIAITRDAIEAPGFRNELLFSEAIVLMARRGHPAISGPLTWDDYAGFQHVAISLSGPSDASPIDREFKRRGVQRAVPVCMPTAASGLKIVEQTDLVCTLGHRLAERFASWHALEIHALPVDGLVLPMFMVWHERFDNDRGHLWLRDRLRGVLAKSSALP